MVWPSLISVSLAPGSYFLSAAKAAGEKTETAAARAAILKTEL
jgi:hypothetical protein